MTAYVPSDLMTQILTIAGGVVFAGIVLLILGFVLYLLYLIVAIATVDSGLGPIPGLGMMILVCLGLLAGLWVSLDPGLRAWMRAPQQAAEQPILGPPDEEGWRSITIGGQTVSIREQKGDNQNEGLTDARITKFEEERAISPQRSSSRHYRCKSCGALLPAWLPWAKRPEASILLYHLGQHHPEEAGPYLQRMETECISAVVVEAYEFGQWVGNLSQAAICHDRNCAQGDHAEDFRRLWKPKGGHLWH